MKKLIVVLTVLCLVLISVVACLADTNPVPQQTQQALKDALADPPVSPAFLQEVWRTPEVREYMQHAPIVIHLAELTIYFSDTSGVTVQLPGSCTAGVVRGKNETACLDCEKARQMKTCCTQMLTIMWDHRQSDVWMALISAVQPGKE